MHFEDDSGYMVVLWHISDPCAVYFPFDQGIYFFYGVFIATRAVITN